MIMDKVPREIWAILMHCKYLPCTSRHQHSAFMSQYQYSLKKQDGQCPREIFLEDLRHTIIRWKEIRDSVIIDGDFNEDIQSSTFTDWKDRVGLEDVMKKRMEDSSSLPNTFNRDTKPIDTIIVNQRRTPVFNGLIAPIMTTWLF